MSLKFNISEILDKFDLDEREKKNLIHLFDLTNFFYDDEQNLTKTFNLVKKAREKLRERIQEMFEFELINEEMNDISNTDKME